MNILYVFTLNRRSCFYKQTEGENVSLKVFEWLQDKDSVNA